MNFGGLFTDYSKLAGEAMSGLEHLDRGSNALQGYYTQGFDLDALKKGWNLEEQYDFEDLWRANPQSARGWAEREGFLDHASYVGSLIPNLTVDPFMLVPGGGMLKTSKKAKVAKENYKKNIPDAPVLSHTIRDSAGEVLTGTPNYLPGYYQGKPINAIVKGGIEGLKNFVSLNSDPVLKAYYKQYGINPTLLSNKSMLEKGATQDRVLHEIYSRLIHNAHINQQMGNKIAYPKEMLELQKRMFQSDYVKFTPTAYKDNLSKEWLKNSKQYVNTKDLDFINAKIGQLWVEKSPNNLWKGEAFGASPVAEIVIKAPDSRHFGRHWNDLKTKRGNTKPGLNRLADLFGESKSTMMTNTQGNFKDTKSLAVALSQKGFKLMKDNTGKIARDEDGVWINFSHVGTPITEGGVNTMVKINRDGKFMAVVSDEYNFLEKIGGTLPLKKRIVAITPPMIGDIRKIKFKQTTKGTSKEKLDSYIAHTEKKSSKNFDKWQHNFGSMPSNPQVTSKATNTNLLKRLKELNAHPDLIDFYKHRGNTHKIGTGMFLTSASSSSGE